MRYASGNDRCVESDRGCGETYDPIANALAKCATQAVARIVWWRVRGPATRAVATAVCAEMKGDRSGRHRFEAVGTAVSDASGRDRWV